MATFSTAAVLLVAWCCFFFSSSFVSSGILPGPVRGFQNYQQTYSSRQIYDPVTGALRSVTVTSRQCSIIRRMTQYETVRLPFLCQARSGRVAPLPARMDSKRVQILKAMQAGGWSMCSQPITVPIYRYQRIPVCCPGTTPTPDGGCLCKREGSALPPMVMPTPGQLLQSGAKIFNELREPHPGYQYQPATPTPLMVKPPRPYRGILSKVAPHDLQANSLLQQVSLAGTRGGPAFTAMDRERGGPMSTNRVPPPHFLRGRPIPRLPVPPRGRAPVTEWQSDIARYLAAMMYQKLLVEQQQQILQDEIGRQLRLRQQMELVIAQQTLAQLQHHKLQQQHQQQQQQQPWGRRHPSFSFRPPPIPQPRPIPSPPIQMVPPTMPQNQETTAAPEDLVPQESPLGGAGEGEGEEEEGERPIWADRILDQGNTGGTRSTPMFGNGPTDIPPGAQTLPNQMVETKDKVKAIVDHCLTSSGLSTSMEVILMSGDIHQLTPVCRSTSKVGPCVMQAVEETFAHDAKGLMGRHMMRSVLMSLGQLCMKLDQVDKMAGPSDRDVTSPAVFPNPAPSVTESIVTDRTVVNTNGGDALTATDNNNNNNNNNDDNSNNNDDNDNKHAELQSAQDSPKTEAQPADVVPKDGTEETKAVGSESPLEVPAVTPNTAQADAHVAKKPEPEVAEAAFPLWMILAMVGACGALLLFSCLTICLVVRCRRKKKSQELEREPEKLPVPPTEANIYAASPCQPPPTYTTTAVPQTLGGEESMDDPEFKIPEDTDGKVDPAAEEKTPPAACAEETEKKGQDEA